MRKFNSFIIRNFLKLVKTKDNYILFESDEHHVFDNSFYLYKFLEKYKKLHLYYVVYNHNEFLEAKRKGIPSSKIFLISNRIKIHSMRNIFYVIKWRTILKKCKLCFFSYRNFYKEFNIPFGSDQVMVNLRHGQFPFKNVRKYYEGLCFSVSQNMYFRIGTDESLKLLPRDLTELKCKWFASSMPRIDSVFEDKFSEFCKLVKIKESECENFKFILSLTTFRGSADGSYFKTQFPIQLSNSDYHELDNFLGKNNIKLLIKVHHDNMISKDDELYNSNNIIVVDDNDLEANDLFVNNLFRYSHALLTDYSSVFYDYLYVDKPIGFLLTDYEKYFKERGFTLTLDNYLCGEKIASLNELYIFLNSIVLNEDGHKLIRQSKFKLFNGEFRNSYSEEVAKLFIDNKYLS